MKYTRLLRATTLLWLTTLTSAWTAPFISDFNPKVGCPGDTVYITGNGFDSTATVYFFNQKLASIYVNSDTFITATVPGGVVTGQIGIQQDTGSHVSSGTFGVIGNGPYITSISPNLGATNDSVEINGVHFTNATVKFNGVSAGEVVVNGDATHITAYVPSGAHTGPVSVTTSHGTSNGPTFTVIGPGPYISGFSPTSGNVGSPVFINGRFLTGVTNVQFNGVSVPGFSGAASDTQINVNVPSGASSGPLTVKAPMGNYVTTSNFYMPPSITGISPSSGVAGNSITINGSSFKGATSVSFNGTAAGFSMNASGSQITATVPNAATSGNITVVAPAGSAASTRFAVLPSISSFSPGSGPVGQPVTIYGNNFNGVTAVKFNGTSASFSVVSSGQISTTVPSGATTGPISVTTADGTTTSTAYFYLPAVISSFSPNMGAWPTSVSINGHGFTGASAVNFGALAAWNFNVNSDSSISAVVPYGVTITSGPISVTTPAGTAFSTNNFYGPPSISSFNPTHGLPPSTVVTLSGNNFLDATAVRFNGTNSLSFTVNNNNSISAYVPYGAQTGPISVDAPAGTATSAAGFVVDYASDLYPIGTVAPNPVWVGSNLVFTITIYNNSGFDAPNVRITNTLPASFSITRAFVTQGTLTTNVNPFFGNLGTITKFSSAALTFTVIPHAGGMLTNQLVVSSDYTDPTPNNNTNLATVRVMSLPVLSIKATENPKQVTISWPKDLYEYFLQSRTNLANNFTWLNVTNAALTNATSIYVTETNLIRPSFYRLTR